MPDLDARTRETHEQIALQLARNHRDAGSRIVGINGAQGSGKTTMASELARLLASHYGLNALAVSIDDFYLSKAQRQQLAESIHPLLATRGVPGTHDVDRGIECLTRLKDRKPTALPMFSKADDDVVEIEVGRVVAQPPDLVLFEGWCVGTPPQEDGDLIEPVNELERREDPDGSWRRYVNEQLATTYRDWFALVDQRIWLRVPGWEKVHEWRAQQERETAAGNAGHAPLLDPVALERFLQHYERLTRHALALTPPPGDVVVNLDEEHRHLLG